MTNNWKDEKLEDIRHTHTVGGNSVQLVIFNIDTISNG